MLEPIIEHQKEIKEIFKKMQFLRDNFDFSNSNAFLEELFDLSNKMKEELKYHFNLQIYSVGENENAKKFVKENLLVRDMLFRMLEYIIVNAKNKNTSNSSKKRGYCKKGG